jgi:hypothetical protein
MTAVSSGPEAPTRQAPRQFLWVIEESLAVSERPGGRGPDHRVLRRRCELAWLREVGITRVVSLLVTAHNLHSYDDTGIVACRLPLGGGPGDGRAIVRLCRWLDLWLARGERVLCHRDGLDATTLGAMAGYLVWSGRADDPQAAVAALERRVGRPLGPPARRLAGAGAARSPRP